MKTILLLAVNPKGTTPLRLDEEVREIQEAIQRAKNREQFKIETQWAVRVSDLRRALLDHQPTVIHFSGHGVGEEGLVLENNSGQTQIVSTESLAQLFKLFQHQIECIILNACYSEVQAKAIHQYIDCVIGMNQPIGDRAAIEFATGFYDALGAGSSYQYCFEIGCASIDLKGIPESSIPVLKFRKATSESEPFLNLPQKKITSEQWEQIFSAFHSEDILALSFACDAAFREHFGESLLVVYPDAPPLNRLETICTLLTKYDQPKLTKAFIYHAIETIKKQNSNRDFSSLKDWYEPENLPTVSNNNLPKCGYLLVSLKQNANNITAFAELHLEGKAPQPLDSQNSGERGVICKLDGVKMDDIPHFIAEQLAEPLSNWIQQAESQLTENTTIARPIVLEIFLPWQLLDAQIDEWNAIDELQEPCKLREHRGFIVRSLDRVTSAGLKLKLRQGWETLKACIEKNSIWDDFIEIDCTDEDLIFPTSPTIAGVRLSKGLPKDPVTRKKILKELVKSPVLLAFWTDSSNLDGDRTLAAFEELLKPEHLIEFANLADKIKQQKATNSFYDLGMLCDCPHRLPTIPNATKPLTLPS